MEINTFYTKVERLKEIEIQALHTALYNADKKGQKVILKRLKQAKEKYLAGFDTETRQKEAPKTGFLSIAIDENYRYADTEDARDIANELGKLFD